MREIKGKCLCGTVQYQLNSEQLIAYQCHCSLCRQFSGTAFSTTLFAKVEAFKWIAGKESIKTYSRTSGYTVQFCTTCGSTVPNQFRDYPLYSVPAGALNDDYNIEVAVQLFLGSRAQWDQEKFNGYKYEEMPGLEEIFTHLHLSSASGR